jgi:hypothetical protein
MTNGPSATAHGNGELSYRMNLLQKLIRTFTSQKHTGRKRRTHMPIGTLSPKMSPFIVRNYRTSKVCALCIKWEETHNQYVEFKHPTDATILNSHYAMFAAFENTTHQGILRFKIKEAYINYIFSTIPYKHSDNILM